MSADGKTLYDLDSVICNQIDRLLAASDEETLNREINRGIAIQKLSRECVSIRKLGLEALQVGAELNGSRIANLGSQYSLKKQMSLENGSVGNGS